MTDAMWDAVRATVRAHTGLTLPTTMKSVIARALDQLAIDDPGAFDERRPCASGSSTGCSSARRGSRASRPGFDALVRALVPVRAAASTVRSTLVGRLLDGQEAYTLAMALTDAGASRGCSRRTSTSRRCGWRARAVTAARGFPNTGGAATSRPIPTGGYRVVR